MSEDDFSKDALPCPFCGGTRIMHQSYNGVRFLRCDSLCSATGGYVFNWEDAPFTREESVKRWNKRVLLDNKK